MKIRRLCQFRQLYPLKFKWSRCKYTQRGEIKRLKKISFSGYLLKIGWATMSNKSLYTNFTLGFENHIVYTLAISDIMIFSHNTLTVRKIEPLFIVIKWLSVDICFVNIDLSSLSGVF